MKKLFLILGVLVVSGTMIFASGKGKPSSDPSGFAVLKDGSTIKALYKPAYYSTVKISIENEKGKVIFSEFIQSKGGFVRPYNLSHLPSGKYSVTMSDRSGSFSEVIAIENGNGVVYHVRQLKHEPSKYVLTIPATSSGLYKVTVYESGKVIHEESIELESDFARLYNFKDPERNIYFSVEAIQQ